MQDKALSFFKMELERIKEQGLWKEERILTSQQDARIDIEGRKNVLNMCSNNYLGLSSNQRVIKAAEASYEKWGFGLSSVRFICGTQQIHKDLEKAISEFLGTEDTILYSSCFDANGGIFEVLLGEDDVIISDELNHASIIDGVRLSKAQRKRYLNNNMEDLEQQLIESQGNRFRLVVTDGVFSMDGTIANLKDICELSEKYNAMVMVDDSHAVGFIGTKGRGTPELYNMTDKVDIISGTFGKALGGASGGYISGRRDIIAMLRQRSRPYLFSNTLAPSIAAATLEVLKILTESTELRDKLADNTAYYREALVKSGFAIPKGTHPIVPIMLGDARLAQNMAKQMLERDIYVTGFFYPVVPLNKARIRTQVSAAHSKADLDYAVRMFKEVKEIISD
jgi:glycine C-acetyltransferase